MTKDRSTDRRHQPASSCLRDQRALLAAAARVMRRRGFERATLREIAREAGMLPGSLHYRYQTKEALLVALMEHGIAAIIGAVRAVVEGVPPEQRVRAALRAHLRMLLSGDDAVYVLLYDWRSLQGEPREAIVRLRDRYDALWEGLLHEAAGAGRLAPGLDLKLLRLLGFGAANWTAQWYRDGGGREPEEIADAFWAMLGHGVLAEDCRDPDGLEPAMAPRRPA